AAFTKMGIVGGLVARQRDRFGSRPPLYPRSADATSARRRLSGGTGGGGGRSLAEARSLILRVFGGVLDSLASVLQIFADAFAGIFAAREEGGGERDETESEEVDQCFFHGFRLS